MDCFIACLSVGSEVRAQNLPGLRQHYGLRRMLGPEPSASALPTQETQYNT
jgi:hypothetical protein